MTDPAGPTPLPGDSYVQSFARGLASLGRVLLAADKRARTRHTLTDLDAMMACVQQVRKQGWSLVDQELEEGLVSLSAPITNRQGDTVAALNISGQANRTSARVMRDNMLPALQQAVQHISRLLSQKH